jgi:Zn-dependent protease with chaperone function
MQKSMGGSGQAEFFSTHPSPKNRIKKLKEWIPQVSKQYPPVKI